MRMQKQRNPDNEDIEKCSSRQKLNNGEQWRPNGDQSVVGLTAKIRRRNMSYQNKKAWTVKVTCAPRHVSCSPLTASHAQRSTSATMSRKVTMLPEVAMLRNGVYRLPEELLHSITEYLAYSPVLKEPKLSEVLYTRPTREIHSLSLVNHRLRRICLPFLLSYVHVNEVRSFRIQCLASPRFAASIRYRTLSSTPSSTCLD